jgi:hypothetical protein
MMGSYAARNRTRPHTQDGRPRRRDTRRGKVDRRFAGRPNFRRVLGRHEDHAEHDLGFVPLGGILILRRCYV